jgi:hypothetical protein
MTESRALTVRPPLTPADCDLRDFGHMPLDVRKFRDSDLVALEDPEAIVAAIMLWGASWHQIPAASLPDDDRVLASLAGYGIRASGVAAWRKMRAGALRGFVKCSDGRLYHPLVAEKARTAWEGKLKQRWRTFCATIRKHNERNPDNRIDPPEFDDWNDNGRPEKVAQMTAQPRSAGPLFEDHDDPNVTRDNPPVSHATSHATTGVGHADEQRDMASKGKGERKGEGDSNIISNDSETREDLLALTARITAAASVSVIQPTRLAREMDIVKRWITDEIDVERTILPTIERRLLDMPDSETVSSLAYFDSPIRKAHVTNGKRRAKPTAAEPLSLGVPDCDDPRIPIIRKRLRQAVGPTTYDGWLGPNVAAFDLNGRSMTVTTPSRFMADWVRSHFADLLAATANVEAVTICEKAT